MARVAATPAFPFDQYALDLDKADQDRYGFLMGPLRQTFGILGSAPDILSTDVYPMPSPAQRRVSHQLPLGVVQEQESQTSSSETQPLPKKVTKKTPKKRKASQDEESAEEDAHGSKKQRGRPRVETQDENATDRRRTQIRLAQRAYRHRKETTIVALNSRVSDLENAIEAMNKAFLKLHDNVIDSGILTSHSGLANQLKNTTEEFVALAKVVAHDEEDEGSEGPPPGPDDDSYHDQATTNLESAGIQGRQSSNGAQRGAETINKPDAFLETTAGSKVMIPFTSLPDGANDIIPTTNSLFKAPIPQEPGMGVHFTYSFQETSFARRLHRMCLERGYRNLIKPNPDPEYLHRKFRLTLCFSNRKRILGRMRETLQRKAGESLENFNAPFFNVGGAGTHFPRRDEKGNPIYPPNMATVSSALKMLGPQPYTDVEIPRSEGATQQLLEAIGFGGEWFDSHDVEEYLKTKGIYLDGQSSFVEVDPTELTTPQLPSLGQSTTVSDSSQSAVDLSGLSTYDLMIEGSQMNPLAGLFGPDRTGYMLDWNVPGSPGYTPTFEDLLSRRQNPVTFDVQQFLERLVNSAACLGRAPGFRRQYIDEALALSLQESF